MKYVILIHANPDPWGHPTSRYTPEGRALPSERHDEMDRQFEALLEELSASGELVTAEGRALPPERHDEMDRQFEALLEELSASGELVTAEALADPAAATLYGWSPQGHLATDGPYAEAKEQLAGFFVLDCATRERAEEIAAQFAQPGGTVELRPVMWGGGDDQ